MHKLFVYDNIFGKPKMASFKGVAKAASYSKKLERLLTGKKIYSIGRDGNPDGLFGPAIMMSSCGIGKNDCFFTQQSEYPLLTKEIRKRKIHDSIFVVSDLSINSGNLAEGKMLLSALKYGNNNVIWLDHHPWDARTIKSIKHMFSFLVFGESDIYCATDLVYLLLGRRNKTSKRLSDLAHLTDFPFLHNNQKQLTERLIYAIVYLKQNPKKKNHNLREFVNAVSKLKFNDPLIRRAHTSYLKMERLNKKLLFKNLRRIAAAKYSIGIGFSRSMQTNSACALIGKKLSTDIRIFVNVESGGCGVRSTDNIDSSFLSEYFSGGGHPQASGFMVNTKKYQNFNKAGIEKFTEDIKKAVR